MKAFALAALAALVAGCSQSDEGNKSTLKAGHRLAQIGPLSLEYDAKQLVIAEVSVPLPTDDKRQIRGMKLIAKAREESLEQPQCPDQPAQVCKAEAEGGLTLTMLNRPMAEIAGNRRTQPATLAGRQGVTWEGRFGGKPATFTLLPVDQQTLMIIRQTGGEGAPSAATLDALIAAIDFDPPPPAKGK